MRAGRPKPGPRPDQQPPKPGPARRWIPYVLCAMVAVIVFTPRQAAVVGTEVALSKVTSLLEEGSLRSAEFDDNTNRLTVVTKNGKTVYAQYPFTYSREYIDRFMKAGVKTTTKAPSSPNLFGGLLISLLPVALLIAFFVLMSKRGGGLGLAKMSSKKTNPVDVPTTRFSDVAGAEEAVADLSEVVTLLNAPERYTATGAKPPRGFLLVGPPGTGKTLLARAVAGEAGVPFYSIAGSDFVEMFVGLGASRVRQLFEKAREQEKAIIFIDEIDAIGKKRSGSSGFLNGNDERENTLNQLLVELDGFTQSGIVMIAATNRPDTLDPALTRPGRFDRKIMVPPPDRRGRLRLLELYSTGKPFEPSIDFDSVARRTPGMTGAEIAALVNEAALEAARQGSPTVEATHLESALATTVLGRERKGAQVTDHDREIVAWHEAGHTVAALVLDDAQDPVTVTIIPRGPAGGVTWMSGSENDFLTRRQAIAQLSVSMAGRAAEEMLLGGDYTQGAHGDLQSATALATEMVTRYGMGKHLVAVNRERILGGFDELDVEIAGMLSEALEEARKVLRANEALLRRIAGQLLEDETLHAEELQSLLAEHRS